MLRKYLLVLPVFICTILLSASICGAGSPKEITVSAAISLKNAFEEIGKVFMAQYNGAKVNFNFGASGGLMRQIEGGAPVDVFAAAAQKDMDEAEKKELIMPGTRVDIAANAVVLVIPADAKHRIRSFDELADSSIKKIAVGNPKTVPAGRYAEEVFQHYKIAGRIKEKLIFTENVRQALDYAARGEVDAGVVYMTDAVTRPQDVMIVAIAPEASHKQVVYPIAVIRSTGNESLAKEFVKTVMSDEGRKILKKYGFQGAPKK